MNPQIVEIHLTLVRATIDVTVTDMLIELFARNHTTEVQMHSNALPIIINKNKINNASDTPI